MEKKSEMYKGIFCQDDQHFHRGQVIKYLMVKQEKGSINKRLFCDECYLGKYNSHQQYCCDIQELINGNIYEAFKYTKFDSEKKQQYFNYIRNHNPYINQEYINNMVDTLLEKVISDIEDLRQLLLGSLPIYVKEVQKFAEKYIQYFACDDLKNKLQDNEFKRSPQKFYELNKSADEYVNKINSNDDKLNIDLEKIISDQKQFFNLDRFNLSFEEIIQSIITMQQRTFSDYKFSQSALATPYIEKIVDKISPGTTENFIKNLNLIYRMTQHGSYYQKLQQIPNLETQDTITIIQTKNKCIFGVYNCISNPNKSILFQMNKEQYFLLQENKKALQLNKKADLSSWILNFGEGDIIINSTFTRCTSNLGKGFDISGSKIFDKQEYLSDCQLFDIYDMEIFLVGKDKNKEEKPVDPNAKKITTPPMGFPFAPYSQQQKMS